MGLGTIPSPLWSGFLIYKSKDSDWRSGSPIQFEYLQVQKSPEDLWPPASRPLNHVGLLWDQRTLDLKNLSLSQVETAHAMPRPHPPGFQRSASQPNKLQVERCSDPCRCPLPGHTPSLQPPFSPPWRVAPCSPLRRQQSFRRATAATATTENRYAQLLGCMYTQPPWQRVASGGSGSIGVVAEMKSAALC